MHFAPLPLGDTVALESGTASVDVAPACGARLIAFDIGGDPVLRRAVPSSRQSPPPYSSAGFPLIPYSGPIFGGGFHFGGTFHLLARNLTDEPDATHGYAWLMPWQITEQSRSTLSLTLDYQPAPDHFPFAWSAALTYRLDDTALRVDLAITNTDRRPMPAGMGFHPYFPRAARTTLQFTHGGVWPPDSDDALRVTPAPLPGLDFNAARDLTGFSADRCYEHWDGTATLRYADGRVTTLMASPTFGKLQLYAPWDDPFVCVEPVTNANDGFNRALWDVPGHGVVTLAPDETLAGWFTISTRRADV